MARLVSSRRHVLTVGFFPYWEPLLDLACLSKLDKVDVMNSSGVIVFSDHLPFCFTKGVFFLFQDSLFCPFPYCVNACPKEFFFLL